MSEDTWKQVDEYFGSHLAGAESVFDAVLETNAAEGLPAYDVSLLQAKFLHLLIRMQGSRRVLEVGTLGGYSTLWMARAVPADGSVVTLELEPQHAEVARQNLEQFNMSSKVRILVGDASQSLERLDEEAVEPFDFVFIDADKANNPAYFRWAMKLTRDGGVIVVDNVVRDGAVLEIPSDDPSVQGVHELVEAIRHEPTAVATALQTVGEKGYDGFIMVVVDRSREIRIA